MGAAAFPVGTLPPATVSTVLIAAAVDVQVYDLL
jgi:hypothetical protein